MLTLSEIVIIPCNVQYRYVYSRIDYELSGLVSNLLVLRRYKFRCFLLKIKEL